MDTTEAHMADSNENTVQAIPKWLSWITIGEMHQTVRKQLEHPNEQYHLHLETTYKALTQPSSIEKTEATLDALPASESPTKLPIRFPAEDTMAPLDMTTVPNGLMDHTPT
jgi:hypothetical protein